MAFCAKCGSEVAERFWFLRRLRHSGECGSSGWIHTGARERLRHSSSLSQSW